MGVFDYIFYRITVFSIRKWHEEYPWVRGVCVVAVLHSFILLDLAIPLYLQIGNDMAPYLSKPVLTLVIIIAMCVNWYRYRRVMTYEALDAKWRDEEPGVRARKKWLSIAFVVLVVSPPIVIGVLRHNLHWI